MVFSPTIHTDREAQREWKSRLADTRALYSHILANKEYDGESRMSFRSRSAMPCFLFARKKESVRPLLAFLAGTFRTRDGHSAGKFDPSMPAEAKALVSAKFPARATPRPAGRRRMGSSPLKLWFPYAPITEPSTITFAPVSALPVLPWSLHYPRKQSPWGIFGSWWMLTF